MDIPQLGIGTYKLNKDQTHDITKFALQKTKCRLVDTAMLYRNESSVGLAIKDSGIDRKYIYLVSKIHKKYINKDQVNEAIDLSIKELGCDPDLMLLHVPGKNDIVNIHGYESLKESGIRHIGVSNYKVDHLRKLMEASGDIPYVNQIELSPFYRREKLVQYCEDNKIKVMSHSPLVKGLMFLHKDIIRISKKYKLTPAQLLISWSLTNKYITIPRTSNKDHLIENMECGLLNEDIMNKLNDIDETFFTHNI